MHTDLKLLTCAVALMTSMIAGTNYAQIIPSRNSCFTDLPRGQIERDRAAQAERERMYQSGSTLQGEQLSSSQLNQPRSPAGKNNPVFIMPPRRPLSALLRDSDIFTELDAGTPAPQTDQK